MPQDEACVGPDALAQRRFQKYIASVNRYPGLRSVPWYDPRQFGLVHDLEAIADQIAAEVHALAGCGFDTETGNVDRSGRYRSGRWSTLILYARGQKNDNNGSRCPRTIAVIEANRSVLSLGGIVFFSVLDPDTHVVPHKGPTNTRLRCHLGIDVPEDCGLRVGGITRTWEEGRCVVFDDSFTHEVWNRGTRPRIVLSVDIWHPDLTNEEVAQLNRLQLPPVGA